MSDWFWIRHGPTHEKNFTGWRDVPADLSDRALIDRLSAYLPPEAVVVSSDLTRSVTTADALAGGRTRLPHEADLREFHFGDWDGRHWSDVAQTDPQLSRDFWEKPGDIMAPNGESWNMAAARARPVVDRLTAAHNSIIAVRISASSSPRCNAPWTAAPTPAWLIKSTISASPICAKTRASGR